MSGTYQGLAGYSRERPDPLAHRPGESLEAWNRRTAIHRRHAADVAQDEWAAHRTRADQAKTGTGLFGHADTAADRAKALGSLGFGGEQKVLREGHLTSAIHVPGSVAPAPVYPALLAQADQQRQQERRRGLADSMRSSGEGWMTRA